MAANGSPRASSTGVAGDAEATGLLFITDTDWPDPILRRTARPRPRRLDHRRSRDAGQLDKARRTRLPQGVRVDSFGTITDDGVTAAFFETLHFCPTCKTSYESTAQSEFSRVASLGTEGRASAVTVLSQAVVRTLRRRATLTRRPASSWRSPTTAKTPACRQAISTTSCSSAWSARRCTRRCSASVSDDPDEPLTDEDLGPPCG